MQAGSRFCELLCHSPTRRKTINASSGFSHEGLLRLQTCQCFDASDHVVLGLNCGIDQSVMVDDNCRCRRVRIVGAGQASLGKVARNGLHWWTNCPMAAPAPLWLPHQPPNGPPRAFRARVAPKGCPTGMKELGALLAAPGYN